MCVGASVSTAFCRYGAEDELPLCCVTQSRVAQLLVNAISQHISITDTMKWCHWLCLQHRVLVGNHGAWCSCGWFLTYKIHPNMISDREPARKLCSWQTRVFVRPPPLSEMLFSACVHLVTSQQEETQWQRSHKTLEALWRLYCLSCSFMTGGWLVHWASHNKYVYIYILYIYVLCGTCDC